MSENDPFTDDLLAPSLQEAQRPSYQHGKPWKPYSQIWIAFFGGAFALSAIAVPNGRRLALTKTQQTQLIAACAAGIVATLIAAYLLGLNGVVASESSGRTTIRTVTRLIALVTFLIVQQIQKSADRIYHYHAKGDDELYQSLWVPGLLAVLVLGTIQNFAVISISNWAIPG
jgi:hypothetical protein